jgi:uncharacterized protein YjiS (DUF1127 family)
MQDFRSEFGAALPFIVQCSISGRIVQGDSVMTALKNGFAALAARFSAWRERERAYAELSALDDHTLADLGLHRSDISLVGFSMGRERTVTEFATVSPQALANGDHALRAA